LAKPFLDLVHLRDLVSTLRPVLAYYRDLRQPGEPFGDFCWRVGFDQLREWVSERFVEEVSGD
jgi:sulfite reductase (ferredoxin)